jgi:hypothetical protein
MDKASPLWGVFLRALSWHLVHVFNKDLQCPWLVFWILWGSGRAFLSSRAVWGLRNWYGNIFTMAHLFYSFPLSWQDCMDGNLRQTCPHTVPVE